MKKSVKKNRKSRRLKKTVRRTIGALFMVSAIIVAAIPFPDALADGSTTPTIADYAYPADGYAGSVDASGNIQGNVSNIRMPAGNTYTGTAYTVIPDGGKWQLDWQYKYAAASAGGNAYITSYNSQYAVEQISLDYRVYSDYVSIPETVYTSYYNSTDETINVNPLAGSANLFATPKSVYTLGKEYVLSGDPTATSGTDLIPDNVKNFYRTNFLAEYEVYRTQYQEAKSHEGQPDPLLYPKPEPITKTYKDVYKTDQERVNFFCTQVFGDGTNMNLPIVDVRVYDASNNPIRWDKVYIPQITGSTGTTTTSSIGGVSYYADNNGFLCRTFASLIGIAEKAFANVQNVKTLTMDEKISEICDYAFENSFLESVELSMGAQIGNRAFARCSRLTTVVLPEGVVEIGAEAFSRSAVTSVTIPYSVEKIGKGAFSYCTNLSSATIVSGGARDKTIGNHAFYDCTALTSMDFQDARVLSIGKAAYAVDTPVTANLDNFKFPDFIDTGDELGEYVLAGRSGLLTVTMPNTLGATTTTEIPKNVFMDCTGLESVTFPETCGLVSYDPDLFKQVVKEGFYVRGPKEDGHSGIAVPRTSTWSALFNTDRHVPYLYTENGEEFYEVSDGTYVLLVSKNTGELTSCNFAGAAGTIDTMTIPQVVGTTPVTGIKEGCFGGGTNGTLTYIKNLVVEDSQLTTIGDNVFNGATSLETAKIGNTVTSIGKGSFANCTTLESVEFGSGITSIGDEAFKGSSSLENISFAPPAGGLASFPLANLGTDAFATSGNKLTIMGEIGPDYGPFAWSMQADNYMNPSTGVRVCYKTPEPSNLTVILDNQNNLPTLVDYPHYEDLKGVNEDANGNDIIERYESTFTNNPIPITPAEETMVLNTLSIVIPDGVKSIDTKGYFNNSSRPVTGVTPASNAASETAYFGSTSGMKNKAQYKANGLFNGFYGDETGTDGAREFVDPDAREEQSIGNDRITSITLNSVEYLPDNCFNSCEGLETVYLGTGMVDVGALPFKDCTGLTSVANGNENFVANNGILYQNLADGSKELIECFPSRGSKVGTSTISVANDPDLADVSSIDPAAFSNCDSITSADFTGANNFSEIPNECFSNSEMLNEVDLPANVDTIGDKAFADTGAYTKVTVRGREVSLGSNAFGGVNQPYLVSYKDSGVRKAARRQGANVDQTLDDMYTIKFYTYDGNTLIKSVQVEAGKTAEEPEDDEIPAREGYTFTGWSKSLRNIQEDMFVLAQYTENGTTTPGITPGVTPGVNPGTTPGTNNTGRVTPGVTNRVTPTPTATVSPTASATKYTLTVVYGSGSGTYASGTTVIINAIEPPAGKVFDKWVTTTTGLTIASSTSMATTVKMPAGDATITATYKNTGSVSGNTNRVTNTNSGGAIETRNPDSGTSVDISKDGISNTDKAYASVKGSSDSFIVKVTESNDAVNQVATALSNQYSDMNPIKYFAMDISLYDATGQNKIENTDGLSVTITMPIPDALVQYAGNNKIGAVVNGSLEVLNCKFLTIDGIPCISFTATHFSPYTVFVDTANLTQGTLDSTPQTGDGIHPKWFVVIAFACISLILFLKKDKVTKVKVA